MPNSDIVNLPSSGRDVQEGVEQLSPEQQVEQLSNYFEDNYPEIFRSLTTDEGLEYTAEGRAVPQELKDATERMWAKVPDLLAHSSLLVLGAGLDHAMPHVSFLRTGPSASELIGSELGGELPDGVRGTVLRPSAPNGAVAVSLHGGPGWFGDGISHDQFWLPLFAALAERSGVTVVDLTYPLPLAEGGAWEQTQQAVVETFELVKAHAGEILGGAGTDSGAIAGSTAGADSAVEAKVGLLTFGSGFVASKNVADQADFHLIMTPRIPEGFAADIQGSDNLVSMAAMDSRGTSAADVRAWMDTQTSRYEYREYPSEHIIAAPAVWRERVEEAAQWLANVAGQ